MKPDGGQPKYKTGIAGDCVIRALAHFTRKDHDEMEAMVLPLMNAWLDRNNFQTMVD